VISNGEKGWSGEKEKPGGRVVNESEKERRKEFLYFTILHRRIYIRHPIKSDIFYYSPMRIIIILCDWRDYKATK